MLNFSLGLGDLSTQDNDVKKDEDLPLIQEILLASGLVTLLQLHSQLATSSIDKPFSPKVLMMALTRMSAR